MIVFFIIIIYFHFSIQIQLYTADMNITSHLVQIWVFFYYFNSFFNFCLVILFSSSYFYQTTLLFQAELSHFHPATWHIQALFYHLTPSEFLYILKCVLVTLLPHYISHILGFHIFLGKYCNCFIFTHFQLIWF